jgi:hypothetical protein
MKMTEHKFEHPAEPSVSRRGLVTAMAAGAAGSGALASQARAQVVETATAADYVRDPTRWGGPEVAALFPGFQHLDMRTSGAVIRLRHGGSGPPLLLLHGNPQNHVCWHKVAARLAEQEGKDRRGLYSDDQWPIPRGRQIMVAAVERRAEREAERRHPLPRGEEPRRDDAEDHLARGITAPSPARSYGTGERPPSTLMAVPVM